MSINATQLIHELRADFEQLLNLVTGPEARTATLDQMERSLFRHLLRMGRKLLQVFLASRVQAESHATQWGWQRRKLPYHSQKPVDYFSVFGKLTFARAYFYAPGQAGKCPLDRALSLPEREIVDRLLRVIGQLPALPAPLRRMRLGFDATGQEQLQQLSAHLQQVAEQTSFHLVERGGLCFRPSYQIQQMLKIRPQFVDELSGVDRHRRPPGNDDVDPSYHPGDFRFVQLATQLPYDRLAHHGRINRF